MTTIGEWRGRRLIPLHRRRPWLAQLGFSRRTSLLMAACLLAVPILATFWMWQRKVLPDLRTRRKLPDNTVDDDVRNDERSASDLCKQGIMQLGLLDSPATNTRWRIYSKLGHDIAKRGLNVQGTQGVEVSTMFHIGEEGRLEAVLQTLDVPVRALILPFIDAEIQQRLNDSVTRHIAPLVSSQGAWMQDSSIYHSTVYHASSHQYPKPANAEQVEEELERIRVAAETMCPLRVVLASIVATGTGVIMATWQVIAGTDPVIIRQTLGSTLPNAPPPEQQTVKEPEILHTTLARLVEQPISSTAADDDMAKDSAAQRLMAAAEAMTAELCGLATTLDSLRFVQEEHLLALALGGRHVDDDIKLMCQ